MYVLLYHFKTDFRRLEEVIGLSNTPFSTAELEGLCSTVFCNSLKKTMNPLHTSVVQSSVWTSLWTLFFHFLGHLLLFDRWQQTHSSTYSNWGTLQSLLISIIKCYTKNVTWRSLCGPTEQLDTLWLWSNSRHVKSSSSFYPQNKLLSLEGVTCDRGVILKNEANSTQSRSQSVFSQCSSFMIEVKKKNNFVT